MYIPDEEYLELKRQIESLSRRLEVSCRPRNFAEVVEKPYGYVRCVDDKKLIFMPDRTSHDDAWKYICWLGKCIHKEVSKFHRYKGSSCVIKDNSPRTPRLITEMTDEQMILSANMMNEIVAVYNKYYKMANTHVMYTDGNMYYREIMPITYIEEGEAEC